MDGLAVPLVFAVDFQWSDVLEEIFARDSIQRVRGLQNRSVAFCRRSSVSQHFVDLELWIKLQPEPGKGDVPRGRSPRFIPGIKKWDYGESHRSHGSATIDVEG